MTDDLIVCWAELLVDYCLRVAPGETILISSEWEARPLVEACYRAIVIREAHPLVRLDLPGLYEFFLRNATEAQLAHVPPVALFEAETAHARIRIAAESDTHALRAIDPARQAAVDRARDPIRKAASRSRWVVTQYPTRAYARNAGMELPDYEAYVASAMFLDRPDPVAAWQELGRRQAGLVDYMTSVKTIRIEADRTDLTLSVAGRTWINSDGRRNMPSGEIFTGPIEDSARAGSGAASPCAGAVASWSASSSSSTRAASSRPAPRRARRTSDRCSTSTPARGGWASWAWGSTRASTDSPAASSMMRRSGARSTWHSARATPRPEGSTRRHCTGT